MPSVTAAPRRDGRTGRALLQTVPQVPSSESFMPSLLAVKTKAPTTSVLAEIKNTPIKAYKRPLPIANVRPLSTAPQHVADRSIVYPAWSEQWARYLEPTIPRSGDGPEILGEVGQSTEAPRRGSILCEVSGIRETSGAASPSVARYRMVEAGLGPGAFVEESSVIRLSSYLLYA